VRRSWTKVPAAERTVASIAVVAAAATIFVELSLGCCPFDD